MTTKNNIIGIILLAIPTLVLCGLIIYFERSLNTCQGLAHTMRDIFLFALLIGSSLLFLIIQLYKIITQPIQRLTRMIVSLFLITFVIFSIRFDWKNSQFDDVLLSAISDTASSDYGELKLLNKTDFYVVYGHVDWSCSTTGFYEISFDTLKLEGNPAEKSDGILANNYLIESSHLVPIDTDSNFASMPVVLEIERPK
jgi:hypothetical protein